MEIIENGRHYATSYGPSIVVREQDWWDRPMLFTYSMLIPRAQANAYYLAIRDQSWVYLYMFFYHAKDKNHDHDWSGLLLALEKAGDGPLAQRAMVTRSHWDLLFTDLDEVEPIQSVRIETGTHSVKHLKGSPRSEDTVYIPGENIRLTNLGTPNAQAHLPRFYEHIKPHATPHDTWGDGRIKAWCKKHRRKYYDLCGGQRLDPATLYAYRPDVLLQIARITGQL